MTACCVLTVSNLKCINVGTPTKAFIVVTGHACEAHFPLNQSHVNSVKPTQSRATQPCTTEPSAIYLFKSLS